ncbi:DUF2190 domain-containing protein [Pseudomonas aeruginosa]|uniref:DUF2190 family protein n=1 Tax=Pseudomonas aeruginosa TaxID=287 RepID=UPI00093590FC|nr:capsid cement protein [Pseudomonas aeruginosa]RQG55788.1 DUF2190 domain-containing protein [Pseudomonas aeruginosa]HBP6813497.1 DUF2190 family protein [Pseudomonas aeruginosa]HCE9648251.1 DUF2190 family protein [Pseudomonas aeruginosa]
MAKNYVEDGDVLTLIAPSGGVQSGVPAVVGDLVVVSLVNAAEGEPFAGKPGGVWRLPAAAGLTQGAKCSVLDGGLVAAATADSVAFGKITEPTVDGFASAMLIQQ